jgi:hypothetical protein
VNKTDGFLVYEPKQSVLRKINSIRRIISAPDAKLPPILNNGQAMFSSAADAHGEPRSCYNCSFYNYGRSCKLMGDEIVIRKVTWPPQAMADSKQVEYWPVCGYWVYGEPTYGTAAFYARLNPDDAGLSWINAPKCGQPHGGTSCGGRNGGDDCDLWMISGDDKRATDTGFCRVLQRDTNNLDCCSCWVDDDLVSWRTVQERLKNG